MLKLSAFQITLLVVFGSLGVAGVLIFALITASSNTSTIGPITIWGTLDDAVINQALHDASDTDSRFSQVNYIKIDPTLYDAQIKNALASGRGPDLYIMSDDHAYRDSSYALHISYAQFPQSQYQDTFLDATTPFLAKDGEVAVPILADPLVLYWNKDALATAGITGPPQYWDQVPGMVEQLVKKSDVGTVQKAGIALGNYDNISSAKDILATLILQAGGKITGPDNDNVLRSQLESGGSTAPTTALNFYTEFADPSQPDYSWSRAFPNAEAAFASADVAMYIGHASESSAISAKNPNLNFAMAPLPQIRTGQQYTMDTSRVYALALGRNAKNPQGALTIAFLMAAPDFISPLAKSLGMASTLRRVVTPSATAAAPSNDTSAALQNLVSNAPKTAETLVDTEANISKPWVDPDPDKTSQLFRDMIESTVSGELKTADAVQRAEKQLNAILNP
jgi:ABC-type glycerol-3-phosphate transport system substrate-binding protein